MGAGRQKLGPEALLDAAAILIDERGIDQVSLNQINQASGHRNRSAVHYHFGSRDAVVRELLERTMKSIDQERNILLDHIEAADGSRSARDVMRVLVEPACRQLRTVEGRRYLRLSAQVVNHPRFLSDASEVIQVSESLRRCAALLAPTVAHLPPEVSIERRSQVVAFLVRALADQARLMDAEPPPRPRLDIGEFSTNLVDVLLAILIAPTSVQAAVSGVPARDVRKSKSSV
jgi:AcrR family transcriptional regulator